MSSKKLMGHQKTQLITGATLGTAVVFLAVPEQAFAFESAKFAIEEICAHMQGNLGALLMTTAGIGALVAAAFGNFRQSHSLIVTAIGAATISGFLSLYFADAADICEKAGDSTIEGNADDGGGATTRTFRNVDFGQDLGSSNSRRSTIGGIGQAELAIASGGQADFSAAARFQHGEEVDPYDEGEFDPNAEKIADRF